MSIPENHLMEIDPKQPMNLTESSSIYTNEKAFTAALSMAESLSKSSLVPSNYQNKPENCMIALEMSQRLGASPFLIMQNMHIIQGKPSWSSTFIIAAINSSGRFSPLKFEMDAAKTQCRAYAIERSTGQKITGPTITMAMAEKEGWSTKTGSKWKTLPELMLRYRAAAFFGRLYVPEILNGMQTEYEVMDVADTNKQVLNDKANFENELISDVIDTEASEVVEGEQQKLITP